MCGEPAAMPLSFIDTKNVHTSRAALWPHLCSNHNADTVTRTGRNHRPRKHVPRTRKGPHLDKDQVLHSLHSRRQLRSALALLCHSFYPLLPRTCESCILQFHADTLQALAEITAGLHSLHKAAERLSKAALVQAHNHLAATSLLRPGLLDVTLPCQERLGFCPVYHPAQQAQLYHAFSPLNSSVLTLMDAHSYMRTLSTQVVSTYRLVCHR